MRRRADFRRFQDDGVAASERHRNGAHSENDGSVPGRDAEDDAHRLPNGKCEAAGNLGRYDFAGNLSSHRRCFAQHLGRKVNIEARPSGGGADFSIMTEIKSGGAGFEQVSSAQEFLAPFVRPERGPGRERFCGGFRGRDGIVGAGGGGARGNFSRDRVLPHKCCRAGGGRITITDEKLNFGDTSSS